MDGLNPRDEHSVEGDVGVRLPVNCAGCPVSRDLDLAGTLDCADYQEIRAVLCAGCPHFDSDRMLDRWLGVQDDKAGGIPGTVSLFGLFRAFRPLERVRTGQ